jgi:hypothetical protein
MSLLSSALQIVRDDTQTSKYKAEQKVKNRIQFNRKKLEPLLRDRDEVKNRLGPERWYNNPHRKNDYAEKRKQWEMDLRELEQAEEIMIALTLFQYTSATLN